MPRSRTGEACHARSTSCTHACPAVTARKVFFATAASSYPVRNPKGQVSQILTMPQAPWDTGRGLGVGGREGGRGGGGGLPDEHVAFHSLPVPFRAEACGGGGGEGVGPRTFVHTLPVLVVRPVCAPLRAPQAVSPAPPPSSLPPPPPPPPPARLPLHPGDSPRAAPGSPSCPPPPPPPHRPLCLAGQPRTGWREEALLRRRRPGCPHSSLWRLRRRICQAGLAA